MSHRTFIIIIFLSAFALAFILQFLLVFFIKLISKFLPKKKQKNTNIDTKEQILNNRKFTRAYAIVLGLFYTTIIVVLTTLPIEDYFLKSNTVEKTFNYYYPKNKIINTISKDNYYYINSLGDDDHSYDFIAEKKDDKWNFYSINYSYKTIDGVTVFCYKINEDNLYFIKIENNSTEKPKLKDANNSEFKEITIDEKTFFGKTKKYFYTTFIKLNDEDKENYYVSVDDKEIKLFEKN